MRVLIIILSFLLTSCKGFRTPAKQTLDFELFTIETPIGWTKIKTDGIDSYVGRIAIDSKDSVDFNLGWHSDPLTERMPTIFDSSMRGKIDVTLFDTTGAIYVKNEVLVDYDRYRKNNIRWELIDERTAKIVYSVRHGIGTTGVFIDSLWGSNPPDYKFTLYGENLKPTNEEKLLQSIMTLKFKRPK